MNIELPGSTTPLINRDSEGATGIASSPPHANHGTAATAVPYGDTVSFTRTVEILQRLETELQSIPVVDQSAIDRVSEALSAGNFNIDPARVANKFVNFETLLSG